MSTTMTLSDLMIAVRQRADMLPSGYSPSLTATNLFVTDPELISYINQSAFELYDILVSEFGEDYFVAPTIQFLTDGVSNLFALPNGGNFSGAPALLKLLGVDLGINGTSNFVTLKPFQFSERNRRQSPYGLRFRDIRYRLSGGNLLLEPTPVSNQLIQLWYVPRMTPMAALTDTFDGISGWTEYVIVDAAIKCAQKEESDVSVLMAQKQSIFARIQAAAQNRDEEPYTVADTARYGYQGSAWDEDFGSVFSFPTAAVTTGTGTGTTGTGGSTGTTGTTGSTGSTGSTGTTGTTGGTGSSGGGTTTTSLSPTSITAWSPAAGSILTSIPSTITVTLSANMDAASTQITTNWLLKASNGTLAFQNVANPIVLANNGSSTTATLYVVGTGITSNSLITVEALSGVLDANLNSLVGYTAAGWIYEVIGVSSQTASRLYFPSTGTAPYTPSGVDAGWGASNSLAVLPAVFNKTNTANTAHTNTFATGSNVYTATLQYVSPPLAAQTISGTATAVASMQASTGTGNQCAPKYTIRVIAPDGTVRGTLCQKAGGSHSVFDTGNPVYTYNETLTLSSVTAQAGDYLVIERGFNRFNTGSTTITTYLGDNSATDQAGTYQATDYTDNSWINFGTALTFQGSGTSQGTTTVSSYAPASSSLITSATTSLVVTFSGAMDGASSGNTLLNTTNWDASSTSGSVSVSSVTFTPGGTSATVNFTATGVSSGSIISISPSNNIIDSSGKCLTGNPVATYGYVASLPGTTTYFPASGTIRTLPTQLTITFPVAMGASASTAGNWSATSSTGTVSVTSATLDATNTIATLAITCAGVYSGSTITITGSNLRDASNNAVTASVTYNYYLEQFGANDGLPFVLYNTTSTWNQLLPASPTLWSSSSSVMTTLFTDSGLLGTHLGNGSLRILDLPRGALGPYFFTTAPTDPQVTVHETNTWGLLQGKVVPVPAAATTGQTAGDAHLAVLNAKTGDEYGYTQVYTTSNPTPIANGATFTVGVGIKNNYYTGTGWDAGIGANGGPGTLTLGYGGIMTSAGSQFLAGTVTLDEFKSGQINHKISMAVGKNYAAPGVWPATAAAVYPNAQNGGTGVGIGPGSLIWSDLTDAQVDALGWDPVSTMLLKALHNYGGFITDQNGFCPMDIRAILATPAGNAAEATAAQTWWNTNGNGGYPKIQLQTASWYQTHWHVVDPTWFQTLSGSQR